MQLLSKVERVIQDATQGKTTPYKASALLEFTSDIFLYARRLALDRFSLSHGYNKALNRFDEVFGKMMSARLASNMDDAQSYADECEHCVGELGGLVCVV